MTTPVVPARAAALRTGLRLAIVVCVLTALVVVATTSQWGLWWRLITFTYQANLLAAGYYLWTLADRRADSRAGLRGAVVLYVVVAGLIWNLFLTGHSMGYTPANFLLHVVVPLLALTDWLLVGRGAAPVVWWHPLAWLIYPAGYLVLALAVLNTAGRRAPYFFLDPDAIGPSSVAFNVAALTTCVLALGYVLRLAHRTPAAIRPDTL